MQHQREQAERFGLARQQRRHEPAEEDRLLGEIAPRDVRAARVAPAFGERGVDRVEHGPEPIGQLVVRGNPERDAGLANLGLRAREPLAHRGRRQQERGSDFGGVEAEHGLQHQRRANSRFDRGMRAREHQREPPIGNLHVLAGALGLDLELLGEHAELAGRIGAAAPAAREIDELAPCGRKQPRLGVRRAAVPGPIRERGRERLGERVLRGRDVARLRREEGDELAVAAARDRVRRAACSLVAARRTARDVAAHWRSGVAGLTCSKRAAPRRRRARRPGSAPPT